jgi:DNA-binding NarL/FixJ family response regulator
MRSRHAKTVFIVDDSTVVRDRLAQMISGLPGVDLVGQADISFEAIEGLRRLRPNCAVLDISMPGGSGIHVLETIKREQPALSVIMLTNFAQEQYRQKCLALGADYFFDKTTQFEKVLDVLRGPADSTTSSPPSPHSSSLP